MSDKIRTPYQPDVAFSNFPELETERLILRRPDKKQAKGLLACYDPEESMRFFGVPPFQNVDDVLAKIESMEQEYQAKNGIRWIIEIKETAEIAGLLAFREFFHYAHRAEIGYSLHPAHRRKGIITEGALRIIQYGFEELGLNSIEAMIFSDNLVSQAFTEQLGFMKEGHFHNYYFQDGIYRDMVMYSLFNPTN